MASTARSVSGNSPTPFGVLESGIQTILFSRSMQSRRRGVSWLSEEDSDRVMLGLRAAPLGWLEQAEITDALSSESAEYCRRELRRIAGRVEQRLLDRQLLQDDIEEAQPLSGE